jgi:hypothetical protein
MDSDEEEQPQYEFEDGAEEEKSVDAEDGAFTAFHSMGQTLEEAKMTDCFFPVEEGEEWRVLHAHRGRKLLSKLDIVMQLWLNNFGISRKAFEVFSKIVKAEWFDPSKVKSYRNYRYLLKV